MNLNGIVIFEWGRINNPSLKLMAVFFIHSIIVLITYLTNAINSYRFQMDKSHVTSIFILAPVICLSSSANISWFTSSLGEPFNSCLKRKWLDWQFAKTDSLQFPCSFYKKVPFVLDFSDDTDFLGSLRRGFLSWEQISDDALALLHLQSCTVK